MSTCIARDFPAEPRDFAVLDGSPGASHLRNATPGQGLPSLDPGPDDPVQMVRGKHGFRQRLFTYFPVVTAVAFLWFHAAN